LIGLSGYARSGKDTAAAALVLDGWQRVSFADVLRNFLYAVNPVIMSSALFGTTRLAEYVDTFGWEKAKDDVPEVRALLQRVGTDAGRNILGENVWIDAALSGLEPDGSYVVTDCRFPNEAQAIRDRGGYVFRITRPGFAPTNGHVSETALDDFRFDAHIGNVGSQADLAYKIRELAACA
jgi:hypothetical protein